MRAYAARCLALAKGAREPKSQQVFSEMAETWNRLATESDQTLFQSISDMELGEPDDLLSLTLSSFGSENTLRRGVRASCTSASEVKSMRTVLFNGAVIMGVVWMGTAPADAAPPSMSGIGNTSIRSPRVSGLVTDGITVEWVPGALCLLPPTIWLLCATTRVRLPPSGLCWGSSGRRLRRSPPDGDYGDAPPAEGDYADAPPDGDYGDAPPPEAY